MVTIAAIALHARQVVVSVRTPTDSTQPEMDGVELEFARYPGTALLLMIILAFAYHLWSKRVCKSTISHLNFWFVLSKLLSLQQFLHRRLSLSLSLALCACLFQCVCRWNMDDVDSAKRACRLPNDSI